MWLDFFISLKWMMYSTYIHDTRKKRGTRVYNVTHEPAINQYKNRMCRLQKSPTDYFVNQIRTPAQSPVFCTAVSDTKNCSKANSFPS